MLYFRELVDQTEGLNGTVLFGGYRYIFVIQAFMWIKTVYYGIIWGYDIVFV